MKKTNYQSIQDVVKDFLGFKKTCYDKKRSFDYEKQQVAFIRCVPETTMYYETVYQLYLDKDNEPECHLIKGLNK